MHTRPTGRPDAVETQRRTKEFIRLVVDGEDFAVAAERACVKAERALSILSQPEVRQLIALDRAA